MDVTRAATTQMVHLCAPVKKVMPCLMTGGLVLMLMSVQLDHMVVSKPVSTWKDNTDVVVMSAMSSMMTYKLVLVKNLNTYTLTVRNLKVHHKLK